MKLQSAWPQASEDLLRDRSTIRHPHEMLQDELALPPSILQRALVSQDGEHAWRVQDVEAVIGAGRARGLACLGGQAQFRFDDGTCEAYWCSYDSGERRAGEKWRDFVSRSSEEVLAGFRRVCMETDFRRLALEWPFIQEKVETGTCDPMDHLWFVLYFASEQGG